jgi:predicted ATPase
LWHLGYPEQALQRSHKAVSLAHELSHPFSLGFALNFSARLHQLRREKEAVQDRAEAVIALSTEQGFPTWLLWGTMLRGWGLAQQGQVSGGIAHIEEGLVAWRATGVEIWKAQFLATLAEAYGQDAQVENGLSTVAEGLAFVERTDERFYEAELHRLKGELTLQCNVPSPESRAKEAEECFHQALDIARRQSARSWELRATVSLARLWQKQGKKDEARQMLAEIYGWFTEGFDTADLKHAKALLDTLS